MVVSLHPVAPAVGHPPITFRSILGADQKVDDFDFGIGVLLPEKVAYRVHDFADGNVALNRSSMVLGDCYLENGDYDGAFDGIVVDCERVKEGVIGPGWLIVFVFVKRHTT